MKSWSICAALLTTFASSSETLSRVTDKVYFDIEIDSQPAGQIVFGLFGDVVPKTALNFKTLAEGDHGRTQDG